MEKQSRHKNCKKCHKSFPAYKLNSCDCFDGYCKKCVAKIQLQEKLEHLIPPKYLRKNARLEDFDVGLQKKVKHLDGKGLFLWGAPSTGKTHLMSALARRWVEQGFDVRRINWDVLTLKIRALIGGPAHKHKTDSGSFYNDYGEDEDGESITTQLGVMKPFLQADMLIIDDLGTAKQDGSKESDFIISTFNTILNERDENDLPIFITSNKKIEEIAKSFDDRIADRIHEVCKIVKLSGKNRRKDVL